MRVIAVDVGTSSVRLAIVEFREADGATRTNVLASRERSVCVKQDGDKYEQSSHEIWQAICECCKWCTAEAKIDGHSIGAIAFSATCSLVIVDTEHAADANDAHNKHDIIMWMDHRANSEATSITDSKSDVLAQFGGICSPEFSLAKLCWLKRHQPNRLAAARGLFELPDWLVSRCTGHNAADSVRSLCCVVCKWGYNVHTGAHCDIVETLDAHISHKVGNQVRGPGCVAGKMSTLAAHELGLLRERTSQQTGVDIVVATSLIDAHSGMLAMLSVGLKEHGLELSIDSTFCSLAGTSTCNMLLSRHSNFTPGVWGPYKSVVLDNYYLLEAGQSFTGKLIEHCIQSHPDAKQLLESTHGTVSHVVRELNARIGDKFDFDTTKRLHILPSYHGNRCPIANPRLRGGVYGLSANRHASLLEMYVATVESIIYELKFIIEALGIDLRAILVSGGLMKNEFYMQTLADVLQMPSVRLGLAQVDFMLAGSALVARHALINARHQTLHPVNESTLRNIEYQQLDIRVYQPDAHKNSYHQTKYKCYKEFVEFSKKVDEIVEVAPR